VDNIKMDLREIGWDVWIGLIWIRIGTSGGNKRVGLIKCWEVLE
jgi:hypothetical protein